MSGYDRIPQEPPLYQYGQKPPPKKNNDAKSCMRIFMVLLVLAGVAALGVALYATLKPVGLDEGPLFVPDPPPLLLKKKAVLPQLPKKMGVTPRSTVVTATSTVFTLQYPHDLSDHVGQKYIVYSNSTLPHRVVFTAAANHYAFPHCPAETGHPTWDEEGLYPVARFIDGQQGALIHWHVAACGRIAVIEQRHVQYCNHNLTQCVLPSVTSANITELFSSAVLTDHLTATHGAIANLSALDATALRAVLVNLTASSVNATEIRSVFAHITTLVTQTFSATTATINNLFATTGQINSLTSTLFGALNGTITNLFSNNGQFGSLSSVNLNVAGLANIQNLIGLNANITNFFGQIVNAVSAVVGNLTVNGQARFWNGIGVTGNSSVTGTLEVSNLVITDSAQRDFYVGPTRTYQNLSSVLRLFNRQHAGPVRIFMDPGTYTEHVNIGSQFSSSPGILVGNVNYLFSAGLSIFGDKRGHVGITYFNGMPFMFQFLQINYVVVTSTGAVFPAAGSSYDSDGYIANVGAVTVDDGVAPTVDGCETPFANAGALAGKVAIIQRGLCNMYTKSANAAANGAVATIIYQNTADPPFTASGMLPNLPGLTVMISQADGATLQGLLLANASMTVSIAPRFGLPTGATTQLVHPGGLLNKLQITVGGTPVGISSQIGDKVTIVSASLSPSSPTYHTRRVIAKTFDTLTFDSAIDSPADTPFSSITFLPNVEIMPPSNSPTIPTFTVTSNAAVYMEGVAIVNNPSYFFSYTQNSALVVRISSTLAISRVVVDLGIATVSQPVAIQLQSTLTTFPYSPSDFWFNSFVSAPVFLAYGSKFVSGTNYFSGGSSYGISAFSDSSVDLYNLQMANTGAVNAFYFPKSPAISLTRNSNLVVEKEAHIGRHGDDFPIFSLSQSSKTYVEALKIYKPAGSNNPGVVVIDGSSATFGNLAIDYAAYGAIVSDSSRLTVKEAVAMTNIGVAPYFVHDNSKFTAYQSASPAPLDTRTYTAGGVDIDHAFPNHVIDGAGVALDFYIDATAAFAGKTLYQGRKYSIFNKDGAAHTIQLDSLQRFQRPGLPDNVNVYVFPAATPNTFVELYVKDATRVVIRETGGSFLLQPPLKRSVSHKGENSTAEAAYMEYLHSFEPGFHLAINASSSSFL